MSKATSKSIWAGMLLLAALLLLAMGCGASSETGQGAAQAANTSALPAVGSQVGDRIHPFAMQLTDGQTVTSASLLSQDRPTFLLYFKYP